MQCLQAGWNLHPEVMPRLVSRMSWMQNLGLHAGVLDKGSTGEAQDPRGAEASASPLQGSPLSGRQKCHVSATSPMTTRTAVSHGMMTAMSALSL